MFNKLTKAFVNKRNKENGQQDTGNKEKEKISKAIEDIKKRLEEEFTLCDDFFIREINFGRQDIKIIIAFIENFCDKELLSQNVIEPMMKVSLEKSNIPIMEFIQKKIVTLGEISELHTMEDTIDSILSGNPVIYIDGEDKAFKAGLAAVEKRAVEEPATEVSIKGPREGFTESIQTNIILLRRKLKNSKFKIEKFKIGDQTKTDIAICYIQGIAKDDIVQEVKRRMDTIEVDGILATGYIEQFIQDGKLELFPTVGNSEKPDKVASKLLEGRIAIIADGTPTVLTVPYLFIESLQAADDYFGSYYFSSFARILRFFSLLLSIYLPALYVSLTIYHQKILPFKLMITMAAAREGIPFSAFIETLFMIITFEILREAGIRMPKAIGQAVSIVGAIVLGDAAVNAGIASAPLIIVVALSGICVFVNPPMMKIGTVLRIAFLVAANVLGFLGIICLTIAVTTYLCNKKSFGVVYLTPFAHMVPEDLKDTLIVVPIWAMFSRPKALSNDKNIIRTLGKESSKKEKSS